MDGGSRRAYLAAVGTGLSALAGCTSIRSRLPGGVRIEAATPSLRDTDPEITVRDLEPESTVRLVARSTARYERWQSSATFEADASGEVHVSEMAPISGDYEGVDGSGLIWSMAPPGKPLEPWSNEAFTVDLAAIQDDQTLDRLELVRRRVSPEVRTKWITDDEVVGLFAEPDIDTPRPGIIVLHGSRGIQLTHYAEMFASHGFPALALKYFGEEGEIPDHLQAVPLSYFDEAAAWLRTHPWVKEGPLGVYGFSRGGEAALFLAAYADWVGAVVADAPSAIAWQGVRSDGGQMSGSAWSVDGEEIPYVRYEGCSPGYTADGLRRDADFYECGLEQADAETIDAATFPLEDFDGRILAVSGAQDGVWPSTRLTEPAVERLRAAGRGSQITHVVYDTAGHIIPIPHVPTAGLPAASGRMIGGTPAGIARAAAAVWPQMLDTFEQL